MESSYGGGGSGSVAITPAEGGGSLLRAEWGNTDGRRRRDKVMLFLLHRLPMDRVIARLWRNALDRFASQRDS